MEKVVPAHTFCTTSPCRYSITFGLYTLAISPCPSLPCSPDPKDQTVLPSRDTANVCELPHATEPTSERSATSVGRWRPLLSPCPRRPWSPSPHVYSLPSSVIAALWR